VACARLPPRAEACNSAPENSVSALTKSGVDGRAKSSGTAGELRGGLWLRLRLIYQHIENMMLFAFLGGPTGRGSSAAGGEPVCCVERKGHDALRRASSFRKDGCSAASSLCRWSARRSRSSESASERGPNDGVHLKPTCQDC
jgi:hypothetical protein